LPLRVAKLVRVSTTHLEQADSPQHQLAFLDGEIGREGWVDTGLAYRAELTGAVILDRPDIQRMLAEARAGLFDAILLKSISRLGRDTLGLLMVKRMLDDVRVELIALADGYRSFRDPELIFLVHAERAQAGRQEIAKNVRAGSTQAARRGIWPAGTLPFGLRKESRFAVGPDPETAPLVQLIFALRRQGWGVGRIARHLNTEVRAKAPEYWHLGARIRRLEAADGAAQDDRVQERLRVWRAQLVTRPFRWQPRTVRLILENPAYCGALHYNRTGGERRLHGRLVRRARGQEEWVTIPCTPLIPPAEWEEAQAVGAERRRLPRRSTGSRFLLSGRVFCGLCGSPLRGSPARAGAGRRGGDPLGYYVCRASTEAGAHPARYVRATDLEQSVLGRLRAELAGLPPVATTGARHRPDQQRGALEGALRDLAEARFFRREEFRKGRISETDLTFELDLIAQREETLRAQLAAMAPEGAEPVAGDRVRELLQLRGSTEEVKALLGALLDRVVVTPAPDDQVDVSINATFTKEELPG
jgi:site-specific DNA recombinase